MWVSAVELHPVHVCLLLCYRAVSICVLKGLPNCFFYLLHTVIGLEILPHHLNNPNAELRPNMSCPLYFFILQAVFLVLVWVFISFSLLFLALTAGCDHLVLFSQHSIKKKYMYLGQSLDGIAGWKRDGVEASYTRLAFFDMYMCSFIENEM